MRISGPVLSRSGDRLILNVILSPREVEVIRLIADGQSTKGVAAQLHLAPSTVTWLTHEIYVAMSFSNRVDVTNYVRANEGNLNHGRALEAPAHRPGCLCRHCEAA